MGVDDGPGLQTGLVGAKPPVHHGIGRWRTRFLAHVGLGGLSQAQTLRSIELLATEVLPAVRAALKQ